MTVHAAWLKTAAAVSAIRILHAQATVSLSSAEGNTDIETEEWWTNDAVARTPGKGRWKQKIWHQHLLNVIFCCLMVCAALLVLNFHRDLSTFSYIFIFKNNCFMLSWRTPPYLPILPPLLTIIFQQRLFCFVFLLLSVFTDQIGSVKFISVYFGSVLFSSAYSAYFW